MTQEIYLEMAGLEHATKQPSSRRYALFCQGVLRRLPGAEWCATIGKGGHITDCQTYQRAKELGIDHPHSVVIRFYPDFDCRTPSEDFLDDFKNQSS